MELGTAALAATFAATTLAPSASITQRYPNIEMRLMNWENTRENPVSCYRFVMDYKSGDDNPTRIEKKPEANIEFGSSCIDKVIGFLPYEGLNLLDETKQDFELRLIVQKYLSPDGLGIRNVEVLMEHYVYHIDRDFGRSKGPEVKSTLSIIPLSWNQITPPESIVIAIDGIIKGADLKESTISLHILAQQPITLFAAALNRVVKNIEMRISCVAQVKSAIPADLHSLLEQRIGRDPDDD